MTAGGPAAGRDPVDAYLDRLLAELQGNAADVRRVLAEAEEHLRDAVEEGTARGLTLDEAQRQAVARFGPARLVARRFAAGAPPRLSRQTLGQLVMACLLLGSVGCMAIGASGALAAGMGAAFGKTFVSGDAPDIRYTPARCAYFLEYSHEPTCEEAAAAHHYDEVVGYRLAAGLLGLLGFGVYRYARRRSRPTIGTLPDGFVPITGAAVFGLAAAAFTFQGLAPLPTGSSAGAGQWLSAGVVALALAGCYALRLARVLAVRAA